MYIGNYDAPVSGTVDSVSNSTSITSNGLSAVSVRVKLANPGAVSDSFTASARIGNYARRPSIWAEPPLSTPVPAAPFRA